MRGEQLKRAFNCVGQRFLAFRPACGALLKLVQFIELTIIKDKNKAVKVKNMDIRTILIPLVFLSGLCAGFSAGAVNTINTDKAANWVADHDFSLPASMPMDAIEGGVYYILTDKQIRVPESGPPTFFSHYAEMVVNQQGLENLSQINIEYDPSYEAVVFNSLYIHRDGKLINKLPGARISVIQRETDLENQLYDGRLTANVILDDVRVGDIVEYSFTREGANPVYNNIFAYERPVEWSVPVHQQRIRVLWGKAKPLYVKTLNSDVRVTERQLGSWKEYSVAYDDSKPVNINSETPPWYRPHGMVFFSETKSWAEIARWALPLYERAIEAGPEIAGIADTIRARYKDPAQQIVEALKFVQGEIRYLGIEMGENSHMPSSPGDTLQRRYGDCKDKAVLFISILKLLGVEARPALVNTGITQHISRYPPVINAFDHVLVKVQYDNDVFWLDPTRQYQHGRLVDIFQPDHGYALVIDKETKSLERMLDRPGYSKLIIEDRFDLTEGGDKDVIYEVNTRYYGYQAERLRYQMADSGLAGLQDSYQEFYSGYYTAVEPLMKLEIEEDKATGSLLQKEKYLLTRFWEKNTEDKEYNAAFYANSIRSYLEKPEQLNRNSPYAIVYPANIKQTIDVVLKSNNWEFHNEEFIEDNKIFFYKANVTFDKQSSTLRLAYEYVSRVDHVGVEEFDEYMSARARARDNADYGIVEYFNNHSSGEDGEDADISGQIVNMLLVIYLVSLVFVIVNWRLDSRKQPSFNGAVFYPVSLVKLLVLSVVTFGFYTMYWFYRNWLYRKQRDGSSIMPVARGIFNIFWYYPLYKSLVADSVERYQENRVLIKSLAILFAILYLAINLVAGEDYLWAPAIIALPLLLFPLANYINHVNQSDNSACNYNSRWLFRHTLVVFLSVPFILYVAGTDLYILPSDKVVKGDKLMGYDVKFMHRKGVFPAGERIVYFYSDAFLHVRDDGNGFTDNNVFSYWKDEDDVFTYETADFSKVRKIDVEFTRDLVGNTVVTIERDDGSDFLLYVSHEDGLDKKFVNELKSRWNNSRERNAH